MLTTSLDKISRKQHLDRTTARLAMGEIMDGKATHAQIGAFLAALRVKGEQVEELIGFAEAMRERVKTFPIAKQNVIDTCGTGGDGASTFNISTASAIVSASGGVIVAKHGNRAVSSKCGSADVLEALGIPIQLTPEQAAECLEETNLCFLFAPLYHEAMRHAAVPRKELAIRTVFNLLGPLTNPARADRQLLGLYDRELLVPIAQTLSQLGVSKAMVVAGLDGLDELTITGESEVAELRDGEVSAYRIDPERFGLKLGTSAELAGGDAAENALILEQIFKGERGAKRDIVLLNAGAILYLTDKVSSLQKGVIRAAELIDNGNAMRKLEQLRQVMGRVYHAS
ncbi:anthranilate phosphoribosyltransferase [Brevibacillus laterosporus]|uniref:anthranilate phosphoribosyltransferase n=1 Tax=Brevibacillus laterosporus TaxID=1465 RepID=UPI000E6D3254|nr:anthranilate phosphoribosyltransferase [Brevibacillus laterosporus]AYB38653.1 anthranilate phosphoribosyltransferase [Brevibacillus laterosporus]MBM7108919.1 Anthranilate phosphoribosyltransferase [Brevibacillus laterosporus]